MWALQHIATWRTQTLDKPFYFEDANLSRVWQCALSAAVVPHQAKLTPLVITVSGFEDGVPVETLAIRQLLDRVLQEHKESTTETVANTIFPQSLWNRALPREALFKRYRRLIPRLKKKSSSNRNGLYFQRLVAFGDEEKNQLDFIIETYLRGNHRQSALQAAILDPKQDHTHQRQRGFPCLQQVAFTTIDNKFLGITGFYATQYLFEKAYGNYLGLCRLGHFVATELGLELTRMTCIATIGELGDTISVGQAKQLLQEANALL